MPGGNAASTAGPSSGWTGVFRMRSPSRARAARICASDSCGVASAARHSWSAHRIGSPAISGVTALQKTLRRTALFSPPRASAYWPQTVGAPRKIRGSGEMERRLHSRHRARATVYIVVARTSWLALQGPQPQRQRRIRRDPQPRPRQGLHRRARLRDQPRAPSRRSTAARRSSRMFRGAALALKWSATRRAEAPARGPVSMSGRVPGPAGERGPFPFLGARRAPWRRSSTTSCRPSAARRSCGSTRSGATCRDASS